MLPRVAERVDRILARLLEVMRSRPRHRPRRRPCRDDWLRLRRLRRREAARCAERLRAWACC